MVSSEGCNMSGLMERAGRFLGRLVRPAYNRSADAIDQAPYHVKYNVAVILWAAIVLAAWAFQVFGMSWLIARLFDLNMLVVAVCYLPLFAYINKHFELQDRLPDPRRLLGARFLRKH